MRLIDADVLSNQMYHEAFETDTEMQRWDSGCWIRYKMFENALCNAPTIEPERESGISMDAIKFILRKETVSTNPDDFTANEKFIKFMDDPEIASFGRWQHANGFNTALVAVECDLDKIPNLEPERKTGRWIHIRTEEDGNALYECSECHKGEVHVPIVEVKYCWNCGAKMEG